MKQVWCGTIGVIGLIALAVAARPLEIGLLPCRGPSAEATALRRYVQALVSQANPQASTAIAARSALGLTAPMDTAQVVLVTSDSICTRVTQAVDSGYARSASTIALIVVQYGRRYAAYDTRIRWKGPSMMHLVDSTFTHWRDVTAF